MNNREYHLKKYLNNPLSTYQSALCLLLIVEQLEAFDSFVVTGGYEKFSEKEVLLLLKDGRYPLLLPVFFLMTEGSEELSDIVTDLSQITDGVCLAQKKEPNESRKLEKKYLKDCRLKLEEILQKFENNR